MAADSTLPDVLYPSGPPLSSRLLSFSTPSEPEEGVLSLSPGVVDEGLAAPDADEVVVIVTFPGANDEEEHEEDVV